MARLEVGRVGVCDSVLCRFGEPSIDLWVAREAVHDVIELRLQLVDLLSVETQARLKGGQRKVVAPLIVVWHRGEANEVENAKVGQEVPDFGRPLLVVSHSEPGVANDRPAMKLGGHHDSDGDG